MGLLYHMTEVTECLQSGATGVYNRFHHITVMVVSEF